MPPPRLLGASAFRLALAYAGLFALSTAVLFVFVWLAIADYAEDQTEELIEDQAEALVEQVRLEGAASLVAMLRDREAAGREGPAGYALIAPGRGRIAGDLRLDSASEGWFAFDEPFGDDEMLGLGVRLDDGSLLVVAQESELSELEAAVVTAFALAAGVSLALALGGGAVASRLFLKRLEGFNRTTAEVMDGRLSVRAPRDGSGDEFDRLAQNLNAMLDRIQALMESMRQVSNDIAHDLKTPLSHLRQGLEAAREEAKSPEAYRVAVDGALAETDRILATFDALLRVAQIESGARRAGFADVDLSALFELLADTYDAVAEDAEHSLEADVAPGVVVRGDRELLAQMLANLIENAINHTPPGSAVRIALRRDAGAVVATVADDGPGIPPEARAAVFRRFFRLDASRSTSGAGLGLSLVAAVAELHAIRLELEEGAPGLVVRLRFPAPGR